MNDTMTDTAPITLLLVDDESSLREPLAEYLTGQGFSVQEADSAASARSRDRHEQAFLKWRRGEMPVRYRRYMDGINSKRDPTKSKHDAKGRILGKGEK